MRSRLMLFGVLTLLLVGGTAIAADALVVSDEEQLEQLADDLTERPSEERLDALLSWIDPSREALSLNHGDGTRRYADDSAELADDLGDVLAPLMSDELDVVQRSVDVRGDRGTVALRVRSHGALKDATFDLARSGQGWVLVRVAVRG